MEKLTIEIQPGCPTTKEPFPPLPQTQALSPAQVLSGYPSLVLSLLQCMVVAPVSWQLQKNEIQVMSEMTDCEGARALP